MLLLIVKSGSYECGLRIGNVIEIMRSLPVKSIKDIPCFVLGSSVIRGEILPVVDLSFVLSGFPGAAQMFVVIRTGNRRAALAVDKVIGVRNVDESAIASMPPLLREETQKPVIDQMARLDPELLLILQETHLIPDEAWASLPGEDRAG